MPDNNPVTKAHQVSVTSIEKGNKEGTSTVTVSGLGQFPTKLSNVFDTLLEGVVAGGTYMFHLERGSRKDAHKDKEGEQDWMYFQNVRRVEPLGASAPTPTQAEPEQDNVVYGTPQHDQYYMRDARIMYQNMTGNISALAARYDWDGAMTLEDIAKEVEKTTNIMWYRMYKPLLDGQLPPEPTGADLMPDEDDPF